VVAVLIRLRQNVSIIGAYTSSKASPDATTQQKSKKTLLLFRKLVFRISMYALIPIITQGGWYISEIIMQFQHRLVSSPKKKKKKKKKFIRENSKLRFKKKIMGKRRFGRLT
jgi:ATP/ADP translocase